MISGSAKQSFFERVSKLRINPDALEEVRVHVPQLNQGRVIGTKPHIIPNEEGKQNSLKIYAFITTNDGYIGVAEARKGLEVFGQELREDARQPGKHSNIDLLEAIVGNGDKLRVDVIRRDSAKPVPEHIRHAAEKIMREGHSTPFYVYDKHGIVETANRFNDAFSWVPGKFRNYFAVKALPNPDILSLLKSMNFGADCSSGAELELASRIGMSGSEIMFTANDAPREEFSLAQRLGAIINLDDITHIDRLIEAVGKYHFPRQICFRYNPGPLRTGNEIIGDPREAKYGVTTEQMPEAYKGARDLGAGNFGLHTMVVSNMLDEEYLIETGRMVFELGARLSKDLGIKFDFFNLGGGIGTPYKPEQIPVDVEKVSEGVKRAYYEAGFGKDHSPRVVMECGRAITGPHGYLFSKVRHVAEKYRDFVGLDACMANLMRPGMYGAYHHITVLGKEDQPHDFVYDVTGSLCENNDKFTVNRALPRIERDDMIVIHNGGAHAHAMGFQYNGKLRSAEFLADEDGDYEMIRRAETRDDYFETLRFSGSKWFK